MLPRWLKTVNSWDLSTVDRNLALWRRQEAAVGKDEAGRRREEAVWVRAAETGALPRLLRV